MTETNIDAQMQKLAEYAVSAAVERFGQSLDYSKETFNNFEALLQLAYERFIVLANEKKLPEEAVQKTTRIWGSYLGEVIRISYGGEWVNDRGQMGLLVNGIKISPFAYIKTRITSQPDYKVGMYFEGITNQLQELQNNASESTPIPPTPELMYQQRIEESSERQQYITPTRQVSGKSSTSIKKFPKIVLVILPLLACFALGGLGVLYLFISKPSFLTSLVPSQSSKPTATQMRPPTQTPIQLHRGIAESYAPTLADLPGFHTGNPYDDPECGNNASGYHETYYNYYPRPVGEEGYVTFHICVYDTEKLADFAYYDRLEKRWNTFSSIDGLSAQKDILAEPNISESALVYQYEPLNGKGCIFTIYFRSLNVYSEVTVYTYEIGYQQDEIADNVNKLIKKTVEYSDMVTGRLK